MSKTIEIDVEVTEQDIISGSPCRPRNCPLALSIHRHLSMREDIDYVAYVAVTDETAEFYLDGYRYKAFLPCSALSFVSHFDDGESVSPFLVKLQFNAEGS